MTPHTQLVESINTCDRWTISTLYEFHRDNYKKV